jgi:hypothetical protein
MNINTANQTTEIEVKEEISVVIVSDERSLKRTWDDEFRMLKAFTLQVGVNIVEILLIENQDLKNTFPIERFSEFSVFRVIFSDEGTGSQLKNVGIREAKSSLIAVFEADSPPDPNCLYQLCKSLSGSKNTAACSAKTIYQNHDRSSLHRCLCFLGRGQVEPYKHGASNNAALFYASVAKSFPYPKIESPFIAAAERNASLCEAGYKFVFNFNAISVHEFEGFGFEVEYRRQKGFQKMMGFRSNLLRRIPWIVYTTCFNMCKAVRTASRKRLRPTDRPLALALCFILPLLEVPGMLNAVNGKTNTGTRFR